jgi:hypothetical protein
MDKEWVPMRKSARVDTYLLLIGLAVLAVMGFGIARNW